VGLLTKLAQMEAGPAASFCAVNDALGQRRRKRREERGADRQNRRRVFPERKPANKSKVTRRPALLGLLGDLSTTKMGWA